MLEFIASIIAMIVFVIAKCVTSDIDNERDR